MKILSKLRKIIDDIKNGIVYEKNCLEDIINKMKLCVNTISISDLKNKYTKEDLIICSENNFCDYYTNLFSDIEKYRLNINTRDYCNGEIVYNKIDKLKLGDNFDKKDYYLRHGFTIHSIQGETAKNILYIDSKKCKSIRMLYTAISRAKTIEQIYFIE